MNIRIPFLLLLLLTALLSSKPVLSQYVPHPVRNTGVYEFLDELANMQIISINSAVKPYPRKMIAEKLNEAVQKRDRLNRRQAEDLDFYMRDFRKELPGEESIKEGKSYFPNFRDIEKRKIDLFHYRDSLFSLTVNPIFGMEVLYNESGRATYWKNGLEASAYIGKWGFYASLRDNHEKPLLGKPEYLTRREGGHLKGSTDWSEMKGGITYQWKWGSAGLIKDNLVWGNNYHDAGIFSGNNPSFIHLRLNISPVKWFDFNYFHGWLNSMVVDSSRSYYVTGSYGTDYREVYHSKFISANMFTFTPLNGLNLSAGNSIVYADLNAFPAFIFPLFFYKSVDHSVNSGIDNMNSQMFFDISSRQIKNLHLYATLFVDELSVSRITKDDEWNFVSWKAGFRLSNLPVRNLSVTGEFNYTYPLTYQHYVPTLTFESNNYNIGHYLKDNSREWYLAADYRPVRGLSLKVLFIDAIRGPDYDAMGGSRLGNPPLETIEWHNTSFGFISSYQLINDLYLRVGFARSNIRGEKSWTPVYFQGVRNTVDVGFCFGF